jgi:hypothetical protein
MKDVSYLLATLDQLRYITKISNIDSAEIKGDTWIKYKAYRRNNSGYISEFWDAFNALDLAKKLNFDWLEVKDRVLAYTDLVGHELNIEDEVGYCCYLNTKQKTEDKIQYAEIEGNKLKYRKSAVTYTIDVSLKLDTLLAAESILDGLIVRDYAGSHYTVVTPANKEHLTTKYNCSCLEFSKHSRCSHTKLIGLLPEQRMLLAKRNILTFRY